MGALVWFPIICVTHFNSLPTNPAVVANSTKGDTRLLQCLTIPRLQCLLKSQHPLNHHQSLCKPVFHPRPVRPLSRLHCPVWKHQAHRLALLRSLQVLIHPSVPLVVHPSLQLLLNRTTSHPTTQPTSQPALIATKIPTFHPSARPTARPALEHVLDRGAQTITSQSSR